MNKTKVAILVLSMIAILPGCASYQYSKNMKLVSFEDELGKGKAVGPIRGEDCTWSFLGYQLGGNPTLDRAFSNARSQTDSGLAQAFTGGSRQVASAQSLRYINNVSTENDGFNAGVVGKKCVIVKGTGYL